MCVPSFVAKIAMFIFAPLGAFSITMLNSVVSVKIEVAKICTILFFSKQNFTYQNYMKFGCFSVHAYHSGLVTNLSFSGTSHLFIVPIIIFKLTRTYCHKVPVIK